MTRDTPRISANDLARFMIATDTGRLGIIRRARESVTPVRTRYSDVRKDLRAHLADNTRNMSLIHAARERFEQRSDDMSLTNFQRDDAALSVDVLDAYARMRNQLAAYNFSSAPARQALLSLGGIGVSVNLDLLTNRSSSDTEYVGGALFRFTRADEETETATARRREMGQYAATLALMQVRQNIAGNREPDYRLCLSIDVQAQEVHVASRNHLQRSNNLESACRFIAAMWESA